MNEAQRELRTAQGQLQEHRHRSRVARGRLQLLQELEAKLAEVEEPELGALRLLAGLI